MENLSPLLLKLSQNVLKTNQNNQLKLIKLLLMQTIDSNYFLEQDMEKIITFSTLNNVISNYYKNQLKQQIKNTFLFSAQFKDKFVETYKLILDLALIKDIQDYWAQILAMTNDEQNILSSFVQQITNREQFINTSLENQQKSQQNQKSSEILQMKEEQILILKQEYEELQKKYVELEEAYSTLKTKHENINTELITMKQQKQYLLDYLGLHNNSSYEQIAEKYRKQITDFNKEIQKLTKEIQEKNQILIEKENYLRDLTDFNLRKIQKIKGEHIQIIQVQKNKSQNLMKENQKLKERFEQDAFQIQNLKQYLLQYKKSSEEKDKKLKQQQIFVDKFQKMKKLHVQFRRHVLNN